MPIGSERTRCSTYFTGSRIRDAVSRAQYTATTASIEKFGTTNASHSRLFAVSAGVEFRCTYAESSTCQARRSVTLSLARAPSHPVPSMRARTNQPAKREQRAAVRVKQPEGVPAREHSLHRGGRTSHTARDLRRAQFLTCASSMTARTSFCGSTHAATVRVAPPPLGRPILSATSSTCTVAAESSIAAASKV
jgi:hypothetical protein